jgi:hypothetical protein
MNINNLGLIKTLINKWFILFVITWFILFIATKNHIYFWWPIQYYWIDLIAVPIIGQLCLWWMRLFNSQTYTLNKWQIILIVFSLSILFEGILPFYNSRYSADILDMMMYAFGALFFYKIMNQ